MKRRDGWQKYQEYETILNNRFNLRGSITPTKLSINEVDSKDYGTDEDTKEELDCGTRERV